MSSTNIPKKDRRVVPDQPEKLRYLIDTRGDQRPRSPRNRYLVQVRPIDGEPIPETAEYIENQSQLAASLNVDASRISEWVHGKSGIPHLARQAICEIYRVPLSSFNEDRFSAFVERSRTAVVNWHRLVANSEGRGEILRYSPQPERSTGGSAGDASLPEEIERNDLPKVSISRDFWFSFKSPVTGKATRVWSGWHLLLFNRNVTAGRYKCLLPRLTFYPDFDVYRFPSKGVLHLPLSRGLQHFEVDDIGKHFEIVLVVTRDWLPEPLLNSLAATEGPALEEDLQAVAGWIEKPILERKAAISRAPYMVRALPRDDD